MKRIFIDVNDVVRKYSQQYAYYYNKAGIDKDFDVDKISYKDDDPHSPFVFPSKKAKNDFEKVDYVFEILGAPNPTDTTLPGKINIWMGDINDLYEGEMDKCIEWGIGGFDEVHLERQATLFFLSKICCRFEKVWFPTSIEKLWNETDILITANPLLLKYPHSPEKVIIKIETEYNKKCKSNYTFKSFSDVISEENFDKITEIINS